MPPTSSKKFYLRDLTLELISDYKGHENSTLESTIRKVNVLKLLVSGPGEDNI